MPRAGAGPGGGGAEGLFQLGGEEGDDRREGFDADGGGVRGGEGGAHGGPLVLADRAVEGQGPVRAQLLLVGPGGLPGDVGSDATGAQGGREAGEEAGAGGPTSSTRRSRVKSGFSSGTCAAPARAPYAPSAGIPPVCAVGASPKVAYSAFMPLVFPRLCHFQPGGGELACTVGPWLAM
ncbi:hypothetical protein GCM10020000_14680 [Streptomyces olivoverticillatus]